MNTQFRSALAHKAEFSRGGDDDGDGLSRELDRIQNGIKSFADGARSANEALAARVTEAEMKLARRGSSTDVDDFAINPLASVADDAGYQAFLKGATNSGRIRIASSLPQLGKAVITTGASPSGIPGAAYQRPMISLAHPRVRLFDLLQRQKITTGVYEFIQILALSESAGVQATQGALKSEASVTTALKSVSVATIATWAQVSRQSISDNASLMTTLSDAFGRRVLEKAHSLMVNGAGGADVISGLLAESLAYAAAAGSVADKVSEAAAVMVDAGYSPSAVIINPLTWHAVRTSKAMPGGEYLAGSWNAPATPSIWNMNVIETETGAIPVGEALVIDTACVLLLAREEPTVLISTEDRDNFVKNVVTILAEVRLALAVLDVGGVRKLDLID